MIIDIRSYSKYLEGHLKNAVHIPFSELYLHPENYLNFDQQYLIYCDSGMRSKILVLYLKKHGYNCVNIDGGYANNLFK